MIYENIITLSLNNFLANCMLFCVNFSKKLDTKCKPTK